METLSEQQQELIRKMSDDRLKQSLLKAGLPLAAINVLDRQALMSACDLRSGPGSLPP